MSGKEDYLDSLLRTVNEEEPSKDSALGKLADIQEKDREIQEDKAMQEDDLIALLDSLDDDAKDTDLAADDKDTPVEEMDFPEIAELFEEKEPQDTGKPAQAETDMLPEDFSQHVADVLQGESDVAETDMLQDEPGQAETDMLQDEPGQAETDMLQDEPEHAEPDRTQTLEDQSEIDDLMAALGGLGSDDQDMSKLIDSVSDNDDLSDISELLKKTDENEIDDDMLSLMGSLSDNPEPSNDGMREDITSDSSENVLEETEESGNKGWRKKKKEKREKKEKPEKREKGPGLLQRLLKFLTDEDDEDDAQIKQETGQLNLSDENINILRSIDNEKPIKPKKPKKEKKPKPKKEKKSKKEKKPKPPKPKKEKKEKPPTKPERPLGKKRILAAFFFGLTVFFGIQLFAVYLPDTFQKQEAKKAYREGDLHTVYELLSTKKLNKSEKAMFAGATLYMEIERKLESYENYKKMDGMELEALNALISGVEKYKRTIEAEAQSYGVSAQVKNVYLDLLAVLQNTYGIPEDEAIRLTMITDKVAYTKELKRIVGQEIPSFDEKGKLQY